MRARITDVVASSVLIAIGVISLLAMAPAFLLFVPIVIAAWLLARLGFVPRGLHPEHASVRLAGTKDADDVAAARAEVIVDPAHREEGLALLAHLFERLHAGCDGSPLVVEHAAGDGSRERLRATTPGELARAVRDRLVVLHEPGATLVAAWPARAGGCPGLTGQIRAEKGRAIHVRCDFEGDAHALHETLVSWAHALREEGSVECVTAGWVRHLERETWPERRPRSGAGSRPGTARAGADRS